MIRQIRRNKLKITEILDAGKLGKHKSFIYLFYHLILMPRVDQTFPRYISFRNGYEIDAYERIQPVNREASCFS